MTDAKYEFECNYVAMVISKGKLKLYTNEYFGLDDSFKLCVNYLDHRGSLQQSPKTYEEFINEILKLEN